MQRSVSRLILSVYIAVPFCDEALHDVQMLLPVEVGGGVHGTIDYQSTMALSHCLYNAHVRKP